MSPEIDIYKTRELEMIDQVEDHEAKRRIALRKEQEAEQTGQEEGRRVVAYRMRFDRSVKRFMESILPLDICKAIYPEAYE